MPERRIYTPNPADAKPGARLPVILTDCRAAVYNGRFQCFRRPVSAPDADGLLFCAHHTLRVPTVEQRLAALAPTMRALLADVADYFTSDRQLDPTEAMALHGRVVLLLRETATLAELEADDARIV